MTGMEFIPELIGKLDPTIVDAATKGLATAIGKVAGETGIKLLGETGSQLLNSAGKLTEAAQNILFPISKKYVTNYTERHGILKVLRMQKPVSLDRIHTAVKLLNPEQLRTFESVEGLESAFRESKERGFQCQECPKEAGIIVANKEQYLMVLGAPGMGKTTFLRKVGLEALKGNKGEYEPNCIPVLLELKTFRTGEINFEKAIALEFKNCGLPQYQILTDKFLEQGKLLILLDGLDEVPTARISEMVTEIQDFVDRHNQNRFITSCRIAAYRNNFRRFTDVAIADFDNKQIENFITNWFESQPEKGQECLQRLNSGDNRATKELTQTPLLLTLVCILYQRSGQFPTNRSTLYERALRVLLEEWNAAKEIPIQQLYKGLDTKRKELILSQIAYETFSEDRLFFSKRTVVKQIEKLLPELLPDEKFVDGNHVLKDIEIQHGLLVERAEGIYSFSHLSIQEFLTAQHIDYNDIPIEPLINEHLCDRRWREVFLLLAGLRKADNLLLAMEQKIHSLINTSKLQELLNWVEKITDFTFGDIHSVGKRAISFSNAVANLHSFIKTSNKTLLFSNGSSYDNLIELANQFTDIELSFKEVFIYINMNQSIHIDDDNSIKAQTINIVIEEAIEQFIKYIRWNIKYQIYNYINYEKLISDLKKLNQESSDYKNDKIYLLNMSKEIEKLWITIFNITPEMIEISTSEMESINNYIYANLLMMECKKAAVRVSPKVWEGIESRMLLPVDKSK